MGIEKQVGGGGLRHKKNRAMAIVVIPMKEAPNLSGGFDGQCVRRGESCGLH